LLSLICPCHCSHRGTESGTTCLSCHLKFQTYPWNGACACQNIFAALLRNCERLQIAGRQKGLSWKAVAQPNLPMALLAQRHREWGCLLVLQNQNSHVPWEWGVCQVESFLSPSPKLRTSADSWQAEGAILESCCSASSAQGTACTDSQRLGLLACLATSNFKRSLGGLCRKPAASLLRKCECLQIAGRQKRLSWKAVAQLHLPTALLAQRQRDWFCLLVLPTQTSNVAYGVRARSLRQPCSENAKVCR